MATTTINNLQEGDRITVYSAGTQLDGTGVFIRVENNFLIWVDNAGDLVATSLDAITVVKVS